MNEMRVIFNQYIKNKIFGDDYTKYNLSDIPKNIYKEEKYGELKFVAKDFHTHLLLVYSCNKKEYELAIVLHKEVILLNDLSDESSVIRDLINLFINEDFIIFFLENFVRRNRIIKYNDYYLCNFNYFNTNCLHALSIIDNSTKIYTNQVTIYSVFKRMLEQKEEITKRDIITKFNQIERKFIKDHREKVIKILSKID